MLAFLIRCTHALTWSDTSSLSIVRTTTTTTTTTTPQPATTRHLHSSVAFSRVACCFDVNRAARGCTRWRRCSAAQGPPAPLVLRHERMTVRMALAEALHHSCGVEPSGPNEAPRGLKTASAAGMRPEALEEVSAPQGSSHGRLRFSPLVAPRGHFLGKVCGLKTRKVMKEGRRKKRRKGKRLLLSYSYNVACGRCSRSSGRPCGSSSSRRLWPGRRRRNRGRKWWRSSLRRCSRRR